MLQIRNNFLINKSTAMPLIMTLTLPFQC